MRVLVVVRCPSALENPFRNLQAHGITVASSTFKTPATPTDGPFPHHYVGGKWSGLFDFFQSYPHLLQRYDYFWLPDDDIRTSAENALRFLEILENEGFQLAQPALTPDSYYAYRLTLALPTFSWRRTTFVELMMPVLAGKVLKKILPVFEGRHAALGMDFFWHHLVDDPFKHTAIIDETPMAHTRPRQTLLKSNLEKMQLDMFQERERTLAQFQITAPRLQTISAKTAQGAFLEHGVGLWTTLAKAMMIQRPHVHRPQWTYANMGKDLLQHVRAPVNLGSFDRAALARLQERFTATNASQAGEEAAISRSGAGA